MEINFQNTEGMSDYENKTPLKLNQQTVKGKIFFFFLPFLVHYNDSYFSAGQNETNEKLQKSFDAGTPNLQYDYVRFKTMRESRRNSVSKNRFLFIQNSVSPFK